VTKVILMDSMSVEEVAAVCLALDIPLVEQTDRRVLSDQHGWGTRAPRHRDRRTERSAAVTYDRWPRHTGVRGSNPHDLDDRTPISADHDINAYLTLLARDGTITLVGAPEKPLVVPAFSLIFGRRSLSGSPIAGIAETQEMLDFCGAHDITADVEVIPIQKVNEAYERLLKSDVKYRFSTWPPSNLSNQERYVGFGSLEDI
jgi:hypothetical protein